MSKDRKDLEPIAFSDYLKGYPLEEIADKRDIPIGTIKCWMYRKNWVDRKQGCFNEDGSLNKEMFDMYIVKENRGVKSIDDYANSPHDPKTARSIKKALHNSMRYLVNSPPQSDYETQQRMISYFQICSDNEVIPTLEGLWLCLGISRNEFDRWMGGERGTVRAEILRKGKLCVHEFNTQLALGGVIPQNLFMFISKNYQDMKDQVDTVVTHNKPLEPSQGANELLKKYDSHIVETPCDGSIMEVIDVESDIVSEENGENDML